jgi:hypothetical protein
LSHVAGGSCALVVFAAGCATPPAKPAPAPLATIPPPPPSPWPRFAEINELPTVSAEPFPVQGHPDTPPFAIVRVTHAARQAYSRLVTDTVLPDGSVVAMIHQGGAGTVLGPVYVMEKVEGSWRYLALASDGVPIPFDEGGCAGCHAIAPADHLFGPPRSKGPPGNESPRSSVPQGSKAAAAP